MKHLSQINAAIYRNLLSILNYKLKDIPIKSGQHDFFYVISQNEGITQKELSSHLYIGKSTTAKAVKSLMNKGYIRREKDEKDKRFERLYLTEKGKEIAPRIKAIFMERVETTSNYLTKEELAQLIALEEKVLNGVINEKNQLSEEVD